MGFFDKVRDVLTSSDAERARKARKEAGPGSGGADGTTAPEGGPSVPDGPTAEAGTTAPATHTVVRGDTLASIAERHGVSRDALAEHNGIDNPDLIYPGQVVRIPPA